MGGLGTFGTFGKGGGLGNLPVLRGFYRKHPYAEKYAKYREYAPGGLCLAALLTAAPLRGAAG